MIRPQPASLAPFAEDWVGGDIGGLQALAAELYGFVPEITGITAALNQQLDRLTGGDEGWHEPAASAFTSAWRRDSGTAEVLAVVIGQAAGIIGGLAAELAVIENALEEQAYAASRYGVNIGTDGRPPPVSAGPVADATTASTQHWALAYRQLYGQAMAKAQQARQQATRQLMDLYARVEPGARPVRSKGCVVRATPRSSGDGR